MKQRAETHRIEIGGKGFGEASDDTIEQRAREFAKLNGHDSPTEHDRAAARKELREPLGAAASPEDELEESERPGDAFPAASHGTQAERLEPEDEQTVDEELVQEGIEEADHEARVKSTEE
ncbi:MAG: hypothetical protein ACREKL_17245 [Chthoniobacterales bacterium]